MQINDSEKRLIRFRTPEQLQDYLAKAGGAELNFRAIPISGAPETFQYRGRDKSVTREKDRRSFDSLEDFTCYAFQCDPEGYTHTEYIDFELLN